MSHNSRPSSVSTSGMDVSLLGISELLRVKFLAALPLIEEVTLNSDVSNTKK